MVAGGPEELDYNKITAFDSQEIPQISISDYLTRIMTYSNSSSRSMVIGLSYIDKLSNDVDCPINLSRHNVHRLVWISIMVAWKFYEEQYLDNESWAQISGITLPEINKLERKFLSYIDFSINTSIDTFLSYMQLLLSFAVEKRFTEYKLAKIILKTLWEGAVEEARDGQDEQ